MPSDKAYSPSDMLKGALGGGLNEAILSETHKLANQGIERTRHETEQALVASGKAKTVLPVDLIDRNPFQPRINFAQVEKIAHDIFVRGQDYVLLVRKVGDRYQVADGETRLRAVKLLRERYPEDQRWEFVEATIGEYDDAEMAMIPISTSHNRKSLSRLEEGIAFRQALKVRGITREQLADEVGVPLSYVVERLRIADLPEDLLKLVDQPESPLDYSRAIALSAVKDEAARMDLTEEALEQNLTQTEIRARVRQLNGPVSKKPSRQAPLEVIRSADWGTLPEAILKRIAKLIEQAQDPVCTHTEDQPAT